MNAKEWIQKFNSAESPGEVLTLWSSLCDRLSDNETDEVTLEVHRSVGKLVIKSVNEVYKDEEPT